MTDLHDELSAFLAGLDGDLEDIPEEFPVPTDVDEANRLLRRVRLHEQAIERVDDAVTPELRRLAEFRDRRIEIHRGAITRAARALEGWMRAQGRERGTRTEKLPNGEARLRPGKIGIASTVSDESDVARFLVKKHPGWVRVKHELDRAALAKKDSGVTLLAKVDDAKLLEFLGGAGEGFEWWLCADGDGEQIAGLALRVPTIDTFGYTTAKATAVAEVENDG